MKFVKKVLAVLIPVVLVATMLGSITVVAGPTDAPTVSWRMAGVWNPIGGQTTATANISVNVRSSPTQRPNGYAAGISNANVIGRLERGQVVDIVGHEVVRAWVTTDVSRRSDIGYTGASRWINIRADQLEGWVYIAFLDFN